MNVQLNPCICFHTVNLRNMFVNLSDFVTKDILICIKSITFDQSHYDESDNFLSKRSNFKWMLRATNLGLNIFFSVFAELLVLRHYVIGKLYED